MTTKNAVIAFAVIAMAAFLILVLFSERDPQKDFKAPSTPPQSGNSKDERIEAVENRREKIDLHNKQLKTTLAAEIKGKIVPSTIYPQGPFYVSIRKIESPNTLNGTVTDQQNEFLFSKLESGAYELSVKARKPGTNSNDAEFPLTADIATRRITLSPEEQKSITISLEDGEYGYAMIYGILEPVEENTVYRITGEVPGSPSIEVFALADGTFNLGKVKPGFLTVTVQSGSTQQNAHTFVTAHQQKVEALEDLRLRIELPQLNTFEVNLVNALSGAKIPSGILTYVRVDPAQEGVMRVGRGMKNLSVDLQGHTLSLNSGTYSFLAVAPGYGFSFKEKVQISQNDSKELLFEMEPIQKWNLVLLDRTGTPLRNTEVFILETPTAKLPTELQPSTTTNNEGKTENLFLLPQAYKILLRDPKGNTSSAVLHLEGSPSSVTLEVPN